MGLICPVKACTIPVIELKLAGVNDVVRLPEAGAVDAKGLSAKAAKRGMALKASMLKKVELGMSRN